MSLKMAAFYIFFSFFLTKCIVFVSQGSKKGKKLYRNVTLVVEISDRVLKSQVLGFGVVWFAEEGEWVGGVRWVVSMSQATGNAQVVACTIRKAEVCSLSFML